jgi:hypothetical protein
MSSPLLPRFQLLRVSLSAIVVVAPSDQTLISTFASPCRPTTLFFGLSPKGPLSGEPVSHTITTYYLGPTLTPVEIAGGAKILPDYTFDQVRNGEIKLDAVLVPGAEDMAPNDNNSNAREFLTWAVPELAYVLTGTLRVLSLWTASLNPPAALQSAPDPGFWRLPVPSMARRRLPTRPLTLHVL